MVRPAVVRALVVALLDRAVRPAGGAVGEARVQEVAREVVERLLAGELAGRLLEEGGRSWRRGPRIARRRFSLAAARPLAHALAAPSPVRLLHEPGGAAAHAAAPVARLRPLALLRGRVGMGGARRLP